MSTNRNPRKCPTCGADMKLRRYDHVEKVGKYKVNDPGMVPQCVNAKCAEVELSLEVLAARQQRAAAIVLRDAKAVDGAVLRYARHALGLKQVELAEQIGCKPETLSRWENDERPVPRAEQLAIAAILEGVERAGGVEAYLQEREAVGSSRTLEVPPPRRSGCG